jgi:DNA invertase Pin-like site-specific DNA recombinase
VRTKRSACTHGAAIGHLQRLAAAGVAFHSYTEPLLSTDNEMVRDIVLAVMASLAKMERQKISERTKAGLERARANGKRLGRAPFSAADRAKLSMVLDTGMSWHAASVATRIAYSTVRKHARLMGYEPRTQTRNSEIPHGRPSRL